MAAIGNIFVADGHIVVDLSYEYNIPLSSCETEADILGWAHHLTEKTWMTVSGLRTFIEIASQHANITLRNKK